MIILAVDNFKTNTLDFSLKEEAMQKIGKIGRDVIRKYDILARLDNDKFILLMPKTNINGATIVAEKIRKTLNDNVDLIVGKFTASFGVSDRVKGESIKQWQERLNKVLYVAQEKGEKFIIATKVEEELDIKREQVEWKSEWDSGNIEIDKQHQELLDLVNKLSQSLNIETSLEKNINQLEILIQKTVQHFNYEEEILSNIGYKDYDRHCKIHKNLIGKVFQLKEYYQAGELNSSAFLSFISDDVIVGHLINEDILFFNAIGNN